MSKHAVERALEMGVTGGEIRACYDRPTDVIWSQKYAGWWFIRGRITLSISEDRSCVITVLWSSEHDWRLDYARGGDMTGRERRSRTDMTHLPRRRT
jgi:hypothetical protein